MNNIQNAMLATIKALKETPMKSYGKAVLAATAVTLVGALATWVGGAMLPRGWTGSAINIFRYVFGGIAYGGGVVGETVGAAALAVTSLTTAAVGTYRVSKHGVRKTFDHLVSRKPQL